MQNTSAKERDVPFRCLMVRVLDDVLFNDPEMPAQVEVKEA